MECSHFNHPYYTGIDRLREVGARQLRDIIAKKWANDPTVTIWVERIPHMETLWQVRSNLIRGVPPSQNHA
jgi:hypothetical protein